MLKRTELFRILRSVYGDKLDKRSIAEVVRMVKVQKQRVMRTRPIFRDRSATFSILLDETQLDPRQVVDILHLAGRYVGLGDWRPRFGRFEVTGTA